MIREELDNKCKREKGRGNVGVPEDTMRGIESKTSQWLNAIHDQWMYKLDIEQVILNLTKTAEHGSTYRPLQKRVMINITKEACGRCGEVNFHNY